MSLTKSKNFIRIGKVWILFLITYATLVACTSAVQNSPTAMFVTPTPAPSAAPSSSPTRSSPTNTITSIPTPTLIPTLGALPLPTLAPGAEVIAFSPNPSQTGWLGSRENRAHWADHNLVAGVIGGQAFQSILQFDLLNLAPNSKILFAALEVTGRDASNLGLVGEWSFDFIDSTMLPNGDFAFEKASQVTPLAMIASLGSQKIGVGLTNRFVFSTTQLSLIEKQLESGKITFRLRGPSSGSDNQFIWDAGPGRTEPKLYIVTIPAAFQVITVTPTPQNIFAAATLVAHQTQEAQTRGTPTRLSRAFATATRGIDYIVVTSVPTASSSIAGTATSVYATAVAATTGTFTPFPPNWATATPGLAGSGPLLIPREMLTSVATRTPTPELINPLDWAKKPLPSVFYNKIIFLEGARYAPNVWVMNPDGTNIQLVTDRQYHYIAKARDAISPDGLKYIYNDYDDHGRWQIWSKDVRYPNFPGQQLTFFSRISGPEKGEQLVFGPAWSPDGKKFAFTSNEPGRQEIYFYDTTLRVYRQLTYSNGPWWWNQFPSWSPDGNQIVFSSDHGHDGAFSEIWIMDADGGNARNLGDGTFNAYEPVWVKWRQ